MKLLLVKLQRPMHWAGASDDFGSVIVTGLDEKTFWREPNGIVYPVLEDDFELGGFPRRKILTSRGIGWVSAECTEIVREGDGP